VISRRSAANILGVSVAYVRLLETRGTLKPRRNKSGHYLFDADELERLRLERAASTRGARSKGAQTKRAITLYRQGRDARALAEESAITMEEARAIWRDIAEPEALTIPIEHVRQLAALGVRELENGPAIVTPAAIVSTIVRLRNLLRSSRQALRKALGREAPDAAPDEAPDAAPHAERPAECITCGYALCMCDQQ
jgi:DNA-binding transcriptional MerR regulator